MENDDPAATPSAVASSSESRPFVPNTTAVAPEPPASSSGETLPESVETPLVESPETASSSIVLQAVAHLAADMAGLRRDFDSKIKYDQSKDRLLDTLHTELQTHREGLTFRILRPVLLDLIGLYDDLANLAAGSPDATPPARSAGTVAQEGIVDILERYGANAYATDAGAAVVSNRQRTINVIATDDPTQDGTLAQSLRPGFEYEGRVLRPEWIEAYRYSAPQQDTTSGGDQEHV